MDDKKIKDYMIINHMPLIDMAAKKIAKNKELPAHIESTDLHEHGINGLMDAISKHNPELTTEKTHSYIKSKIFGAMRDHIREQSPLASRSDLDSYKKDVSTVESTGEKPKAGSPIDHIRRHLSEVTREKLKNKIKEYEIKRNISTETKPEVAKEPPKLTIRRRATPTGEQNE
jgi:DNA-directed RNA polymerase specialized sigma subunit